VALHPFGDPFFDPALGVLEVAALDGGAQNLLEAHAGNQDAGGQRIDFAIFGVAEHHAVVEPEQHHALGHAFERLGELRFGACAAARSKRPAPRSPNATQACTSNQKYSRWFRTPFGLQNR
jgi:hypothetical protein